MSLPRARFRKPLTYVLTPPHGPRLFSFIALKEWLSAVSASCPAERPAASIELTPSVIWGVHEEADPVRRGRRAAHGHLDCRLREGPGSASGTDHRHREVTDAALSL